MLDTLAIPEQVRIETISALDIVTAVGELEVTDDSREATMNELAREAQTRIKVMDAKRKELIAPILEARNKIDDFFRDPMDELKTAKTLAGARIVRYRAAIEETARAEQAKRDAEEHARREEEQKRLEAEAAKAEAENTPVAAASLREHAREAAREPMPPAPPIKTPAKLQGGSTRVTWRAVVDMEKQQAILNEVITRWNARHPGEILPSAYWLVDEKALQSFARATKGAKKLPGVRFESTSQFIARGK